MKKRLGYLKSQLTLFLLKVVIGIKTPADLIDYSLKKHGDSTLYIHGARELTLSQLNQRALYLSHHLIELGLQKGDRLAVHLTNSIEYIEIRLACFKMGFVFCALIDDFTDNIIVETINELECSAFIHDNRLSDSTLRLIKQQNPKISLFSTSQGNKISSPYDRLLDITDSTALPEAVSETEVSAIGFTSGTSGKSKFVVWDHRAWLYSFFHLLLNRSASGSQRMVFLHLMPFSTSGGLAIVPTVAASCINVILDRFDPERTALAIQKHQVTDLMISPPFMIELWDLYTANPGKYDFSSLQHVTIGSAALPAAKLASFIQTFGPIFTQSYGMAEILAPIASHQVFDPDASREQLTTVGQVIPQVNLEIADDDQQPSGTIKLKSRSGFLGYWRQKSLDRSVVRQGWFTTSDCGYLNSRGYLYITDRKANYITRKGMTFPAREVEEVIHHYPNIKDVVITVAQGLLTAWISARSGTRLDLPMLARYCQRRLPPNLLPDDFILLASLPYSSSGKILKQQLSNQTGSIIDTTTGVEESRPEL